MVKVLTFILDNSQSQKGRAAGEAYREWRDCQAFRHSAQPGKLEILLQVRKGRGHGGSEKQAIDVSVKRRGPKYLTIFRY